MVLRTLATLARALGDAPDCTAANLANHTALGYATSCAFARDACADDGAGIFGSYVVLDVCGLGPGGFGVVATVVLVMLLSGLGSTADVYFIPQLNYLSALLRLRPDVAGITLLALGNGARAPPPPHRHTAPPRRAARAPPPVSAPSAPPRAPRRAGCVHGDRRRADDGFPAAHVRSCGSISSRTR